MDNNFEKYKRALIMSEYSLIYITTNEDFLTEIWNRFLQTDYSIHFSEYKRQKIFMKYNTPMEQMSDFVNFLLSCRISKIIQLFFQYVKELNPSCYEAIQLNLIKNGINIDWEGNVANNHVKPPQKSIEELEKQIQELNDRIIKMEAKHKKELESLRAELQKDNNPSSLEKPIQKDNNLSSLEKQIQRAFMMCKAELVRILDPFWMSSNIVSGLYKIQSPLGGEFHDVTNIDELKGKTKREQNIMIMDWVINHPNKELVEVFIDSLQEVSSHNVPWFIDTLKQCNVNYNVNKKKIIV